MSACPRCKGEIAIPSEVGRGLAHAICPFCKYLIGSSMPILPIKPDPRGAPSKPGGDLLAAD